MPYEPYDTLPLLAATYLSSSGPVLAGTLGLTTSTSGAMAMR